MEFIKCLSNALDKEHIDCSETMLNQCTVYKDLVKEWNEKINLTSITDDIEMAEKHFFDSIIMKKYVNLENKSIIDVGTGAGFPGLPLKIVEPTLKLTLLDSLNKRIQFLEKVGIQLNLKNIKYLHGRAEDYASLREYREKYDIATSRAVAKLNVLSEYCLPYVKVGGTFIALKGKDYKNELEDSKKAIQILGGEIEKVESYYLENDDSTHYLVFIKKISKTPKKYPRQAGKPTKKPLI